MAVKEQGWLSSSWRGIGTNSGHSRCIVAYQWSSLGTGTWTWHTVIHICVPPSHTPLYYCVLTSQCTHLRHTHTHIHVPTSHTPVYPLHANIQVHTSHTHTHPSTHLTYICTPTSHTSPCRRHCSRVVSSCQSHTCIFALKSNFNKSISHSMLDSISVCQNHF